MSGVGHRRRLASRFLLAGALFVAATIACGAWSIYTFRHLSRVVDRALHDSQREIDLASQIASQLEREDDDLLVFVADGSDSARAALAAGRPQVDRDLAALGELRTTTGRDPATALADHVRAYRAAADRLLAEPAAAALVQYHRTVNPLLRDAVADCDAIRETNFRAMKAAGVGARDEARRAIGIVGIVLAAAVLMSIAISLFLSRSVVRPVTAITASLDAVRAGDFGRRVAIERTDELGVLADGFNRMATTLEEFRSSNLGEVLRAKSTLETTLETLPDGVIVVGPGGTIEAANRVAREVLNGATRLDGLPDALRAEVDAARAGRGPFMMRGDLGRAVAVQLGGAPRKLLPIAAPIGDGPGAGVVIVLYDVTDLARLDELRGEVVAVASHELRTPLTTLRMNLMMLGERGLAGGGPGRELLDNAVMGCDELMAMIERLLDMARIEAGQLRLHRQPFDLGDLVDQVVERARARAAGAEVEIVVARTGAAPATADVARLQLAIGNVLGNAIKYSPQLATVRVDVERDPDRVRAVVTDEGPGVPAPLRDRVFDKFFRVEHLDPDRDRGVRGVGLGLYLARQIMIAHGGTVSLGHGPDGRGTRVTLELPVDPT